ncbi:MAG TPA: PIN domain-containing protein [Fimbriimonas sp.]|nr:PIN domain-containing protein [Fimbriimonas sp.]
MGTRFVIDTNVAIYVLGGRMVDNLPPGSHYVSAVSIVELLSFATLTDDEREQTETFLAGTTVVNVDEQLGRMAAKVRATSGLKLADAIIVATALNLGATLITNDAQIVKARLVRTQTVDLLD